MLETIREFARERLVASGEEDALGRLPTDWLIEIADRAGIRATVGVPGKRDVDLVAPEVDNVHAVLDWVPSATPSVASPSPRRSRLEPLLARTGPMKSLGTDSGDRFAASRGGSRRAGEGIASRLNY